MCHFDIFYVQTLAKANCLLLKQRGRNSTDGMFAYKTRIPQAIRNRISQVQIISRIAYSYRHTYARIYALRVRWEEVAKQSRAPIHL